MDWSTHRQAPTQHAPPHCWSARDCQCLRSLGLEAPEKPWCSQVGLASKERRLKLGLKAASGTANGPSHLLHVFAGASLGWLTHASTEKREACLWSISYWNSLGLANPLSEICYFSEFYPSCFASRGCVASDLISCPTCQEETTFHCYHSLQSERALWFAFEETCVDSIGYF